MSKIRSTATRPFLGLLLVLGAVAACATHESKDVPRPPAPIQNPITPPALDATKAADFDGVHNVVAFHDGFYSGSVPEGDEGFETLRRMGIRTVISVDGAEPEVDRASAYGMRYVHLPISYNGISEERTLEIARAVRDLPHPVYIHCHHGKHRSAGAAGAAAVTLGYSTPEAATSRMKVSGTAPNYTGLYQCVSVAKVTDAAVLDRADNSFPSVTKTPGFVQAMVHVDEEFDHLKAIEKAGWKVPQDHPDLVPVAVAGRLENLFRDLGQDKTILSKPADFHDMMNASHASAKVIESELSKPSPSADILAKEFKALTQDCKQCHTKYRD
ncbi:MAG: cytochrome c [Planctomycetota bacterium]|nr:cytochrome c [Planctomycetota bacterium]